ncbi:hypothetical protein OLZ31_23680 [Enterobacter asburiae]|nr:hypothetical protein [Enterobacter asburiae]
MEIIIALIIAAVPVAWIVWNDNFRIFPLSTFGIENVQRIAKWESQEWRDRIYAKGGMTSREWLKVNMRQQAALEAEIRRRGL